MAVDEGGPASRRLTAVALGDMVRLTVPAAPGEEVWACVRHGDDVRLQPMEHRGGFGVLECKVPERGSLDVRVTIGSERTNSVVVRSQNLK